MRVAATQPSAELPRGSASFAGRSGCRRSSSHELCASTSLLNLLEVQDCDRFVLASPASEKPIQTRATRPFLRNSAFAITIFCCWWSSLRLCSRHRRILVVGGPPRDGHTTVLWILVTATISWESHAKWLRKYLHTNTFSLLTRSEIHAIGKDIMDVRHDCLQSEWSMFHNFAAMPA